MLFFAKIYYIVFALLTVAGGVMGFVRARSNASLIAGCASGLALLVAVWLLPDHLTAALVVGLIVSAVLAGKFLPDFMHKKALLPGGLMALLSLGGIVITLLAFYRK